MLDGTHYIECSCGSVEDTIRFVFNKEDGEIYTDVYNGDKSFWRRMRNAIKKRYWDHTIISKEEATKLRDALNDFLEEKKANPASDPKIAET